MKKIFLFTTLMLALCSTAVAQTESKHYVNVKFEDGTVRSFEATPNMKVTFGEKEEADPTSINGHPCVKLAGYYWATENVGESIVPAIAGPGTMSNNWKSYFYTQDDNNAMSAALLWGHEGGHDWTLPNQLQWETLIDNCYWVWVGEYNGQNGFMVYEAQTEDDKGKHVGSDSELSEAYTSTVPHIFLPATGVYDVDQGRVDYQHSDGYYRSADGGHYLGFNDYILSVSDYYLPADGIAVRLVSE